MNLQRGEHCFLDEIGDLDLEVQAKLLRLADKKEYYRIGDPNTRTANVRIVSATHKDLKELVEKGLFRQDLYYRLLPIKICLPPLRNRSKNDFERLFDFIMSESKQFNVAPVLQRDLLNLFVAQKWDGNVREFRGAIETALRATRDNYLQVNDFKNLIPVNQSDEAEYQ